ncbi:hypothetical protein GEMRC1_006581 [Eukaryota sp. GEM-RC1]
MSYSTVRGRALSLPEDYSPKHSYNTRLKAIYSNGRQPVVAIPRPLTPLLSDHELLTPIGNSSLFLEPSVLEPSKSVVKYRRLSITLLVVLLLAVALLITIPRMLPLNPHEVLTPFADVHSRPQPSHTSTAANETASKLQMPSVAEPTGTSVSSDDVDTSSDKSEVIHDATDDSNSVSKNQVHTKATIPSRPNIALASLGAKVDLKSSSPSLVSKVGTVFSKQHTATKVIDGNTPFVGDNFAMVGTLGKIVIKFPSLISVSSVGLTHPRLDDLPSHSHSAMPKKFSITCIKDYGTDVTSESFEYNRPGFLQIFDLETDVQCNRVVFNFLDNSGNPSYTAIYRVFVYGDLL